MTLITDYLPDPPTILELDREELACLLLRYLKALPGDEQTQLNRHDFLSSYTVSRFPPDFQQQLLDALSEAWHWLETEGVIADKPGNRSGFVYITARTEKLKSTADLAGLRQSRLLPKALLHPKTAECVWPPFLRGSYDQAIFEAFKVLEVALRTAGGFAASDVGEKLVRKAFDMTTGPLTDQSAPNRFVSQVEAPQEVTLERSSLPPVPRPEPGRRV